MEKLNMMISGIINKDGQKKACVCFSDEKRFAEGYIPECRITLQKGFSQEEINQLESYLHENLQSIKMQAAQINPIKGMMKDN